MCSERVGRPRVTSCALEGLADPAPLLTPITRFAHNTMFGSSLSPVFCRRAHVLFMLFVFVGA
jgi:hypothetical protein